MFFFFVCFLPSQLDGLSQDALASKLTLNCRNNYVEPQRIHNQNILVTILDVRPSSGYCSIVIT